MEVIEASELRKKAPNYSRDRIRMTVKNKSFKYMKDLKKLRKQKRLLKNLNSVEADEIVELINIQVKLVNRACKRLYRVVSP